MLRQARSRRGQTSTTAPKASRRAAILCIDWGSTFLRAGLHAEEGTIGTIQEGKFLEIRLSQDEFDIATQANYGPGQIPSYADPFSDDWKNKVGSKAYQSPTGTSLKYFPYVLLGDEGGKLKDYPQLMNLREAQQTRPDFNSRLRECLHIFFTDLANRVAALCSTENRYVSQVALTIPPQWGQNFEKLYTDILLRSFEAASSEGAVPAFNKLDSKQIHFISEGEALAHYLITQAADKLKRTKIVLVLDFGGHCMNGCAFEINWNENGGSPAFFELEDLFYAPGGSELFSHIFGLHIKETLTKEGTFTKNSWIRAVKDFESEKRTSGGSEYETVFIHGQGWATNIKTSKEKMKRMHWNAFKLPLQEAEKRIRAVSEKYGKDNLCVVFSGGSILNNLFREPLKEFADLHASHVLWTAKMPMEMHWTIARGAGLAIANTISTDEFLNRGAAFGLQDGNADGTMWREGADVLMEVIHPAGVYVQNFPDWFRLKLICDPFFSNRGVAKMEFRNCYDLFDFEGHMMPPGQYEIELEYVDKGDGGLKLSLSHGGNTYIYELPLLVDGANNCLHIDKDNMRGYFQDEA
ncbi:hypothetical protein GQ53DRAFT_867401 [Thozetella sp. PMI_491]|nr:hypothetical protein GQ53DRAFT_867401 [Thozetella sp. PMI_491]